MKRIALFLSSFLLVASATLAQAHTTLISSDPKPDSIVQIWPDHLTLTFGEPLQVLAGAQINKVSVTNAAAESLEGETKVDGAVITVAVKPNTADGPVLVNYRVAAADGHVLDGEFTFSYKQDAATTPVTTVQPHHGTSKNFALVATSTVLIVIGLLFGIFIYRKK